ncbi:SDR family NAD(P)-dependent oxidoreductase [Robiginitomaculum antarcticum]|uniref:SDR family NAD(P)-dependent oxidoreductase n=1 Tax=Robiginitomaculum antarcticum TaxID=437507 RepID=UPI0004755387|nr:SDR family NAD(P)-dependent oxidoreductase [Robiginitomaculum antarcticum]
MTILVTGAAGFIGSHLCRRLLNDGRQVVGVDSLNDYYDPDLKRARLQTLAGFDRFRFAQVDLAQSGALEAQVDKQTITHIVHLAAQAGVRYSLENPHAYAQSNLIGHLNMLEFARGAKALKHMAYASSSSVYGDRAGGPFVETDETRSPVSLYAATKLGGEMLSESYARLYGIALSGLRFFTVYGPWGRPDMAYWIFTEKILRGEPITLFSAGEMSRDFTYIDDITDGISRLLETDVPRRDGRAHEIYNLGNNTPNALMDLVAAVEAACGQEAQKIYAPRQAGDVSRTFASIDAAKAGFGYNPQTKIAEGIPRFVKWYRDFYQV